MKKKIAIALSGGVDSLVAAHLLKNQGHDLFGIHFKNGYEKEDAKLEKIECQLNIPVRTVQLKDVFEKKVVQYFIATYLKGMTPNPCLMCNRVIKFGALYEAASGLGASLMATGHYVRNNLFKGIDGAKEQSYFLSMVKPEKLTNIIFPLGNMTKKEVLLLAEKNSLTPLEKKESQDICFIKSRSVSDFIISKTGISFKPGDIITPDGEKIGVHHGLHRFTIGQRRGINCPGHEPYYVKAIDMKNNRLVVGLRQELMQKNLIAKDINWLMPPPEAPVKVQTKIRYSHPPSDSILIPESNQVQIIFDEPQYAVTPGQAAVFYKKDQVMGAGIIQQDA